MLGSPSLLYCICLLRQYSGEGEPNLQKAWEQIAIIVTSCRNKIKDRSDQW